MHTHTYFVVYICSTDMSHAYCYPEQLQGMADCLLMRIRLRAHMPDTVYMQWHYLCRPTGAHPHHDISTVKPTSDHKPCSREMHM